MFQLEEYGYCADTNIELKGRYPARVTEVHRNLYKVICEHGEILASLKGSFFHKEKNRSDFPAVGDFVLIQYSENGYSLIVKVLERKSKFSRTDFTGHAASYVKNILEQVVAVNFDYVFIMSSLNHDFNVERISRYITAAIQSGGIPVIILTKADLCENFDEQLEALKVITYDIDIVTLSSFTGMGLDKLDKYLQKSKTIVFLGSSGVGKSSLLNALLGEEKMLVKEIRENDSRGRHTTTHRELIKLPSGALIIDTPGMRELGLWDANEGIQASFSDIEDLFSQCHFSDCSHQKEPNCAIQKALENGDLSQEHWNSYLSQKSETDFVSKKTAYLKKKKKPDKSGFIRNFISYENLL